MNIFGMMLPFLGAGFLSVLIGYFWYHPSLFGKPWMRMTRITPEIAEAQAKRMPVMAFVGFLAAIWIAYVMSFVLAAFQVYDIFGAIEVGFWLWAGFVAPTMIGMVLWEGKPLMLYLINAAYWLVALIVIAGAVFVGVGGAPSSQGPMGDSSAQVMD